MSEDWRELREGWERVRWARAQRFETAQAAAESLGMKPDTYRAYERRPDSSKHTKLDHQSAARFARKFGVRWEWLLVGDGTPTGGPGGDTVLAASPENRIVTALRGIPRERQEAIAEAVEALAKIDRPARGGS